MDSFFLKLFRIHRIRRDNDARVFVLFAKLAGMGWHKDPSGFGFFAVMARMGWVNHLRSWLDL